MNIIPAIDLIGGKCVRLVQGDFARASRYLADPVELACEFESHGLKYLHLVDLDGARAGRPHHLHILQNICSATNLIVDFGGGIQTQADLQAALDAGADSLNVGSLALTNPAEFVKWIRLFGPERIILAADTRTGRVAAQAWQSTSECDVFTYIAEFVEKGLRRVCCTDIERDGMLSGPAFELYAQIRRQAPQVELTASGGVTSMQDIRALKAAGVAGVIIGKALFEGKVTLQELAELC